jgi:hypothetical protein
MFLGLRMKLKSHLFYNPMVMTRWSPRASSRPSDSNMSHGPASANQGRLWMLLFLRIFCRFRGRAHRGVRGSALLLLLAAFSRFGLATEPCTSFGYCTGKLNCRNHAVLTVSNGTACGTCTWLHEFLCHHHLLLHLSTIKPRFGRLQSKG